MSTQTMSIATITDNNNCKIIGLTKNLKTFYPICSNESIEKEKSMNIIQEIDEEIASWFVLRKPVEKLSSQVILLRQFMSPMHERQFKAYAFKYGYHIAIELQSSMYTYLRSENPNEFDIDFSLLLQYILTAE